MKCRRQYGFTFIELIAFILVIGIIASSLLAGLNQSQRFADQPDKILMSQYLGSARMQIIMMNRGVNGYNTLSDPCTTTPALAICTPLSSYATANSLTVSAPTISGSNPKLVSISVSGTQSVLIQSRVYDYAGN